MGFTGLKSRRQWGFVPSGGSRERCVSFFSSCYSPAVSLGSKPLPHVQSQQQSISQSLSLTPPLLLLSSTYKDPCNCISLTQITHSNLFNLTILSLSAESSLPCTVIHSRVPGIRGRVAGGVCVAYFYLPDVCSPLREPPTLAHWLARCNGGLEERGSVESWGNLFILGSSSVKL